MFAKRVVPLYYQLAWEWSPGREEPHIPQPDEIRRILYHLIDSLTEEITENGTGGLEVYYTPAKEFTSSEYGLRFIIRGIQRSFIKVES